MKQLLFIFLMICPLWACSSCQDDEDKLPGAKPDLLIGEWEHNYSINPVFTFETVYYSKIYEFTPTGGKIKEREYFPDEDRYGEPYIIYFTDWSYDGKELYFIEKKGQRIRKWSQPVYELTPDFFRLGSSGLYTYLKINTNF
jgi:hypothetical protein